MATYEVELNKPDMNVFWFRENVRIVPSDEIEIRSKGNAYTLVLHKRKLSDAGEIRFSVGELSSTAQLIVKELPVEIVRELQDQEVWEDETARFEIELSRQITEFHWSKKGEELQTGASVDFLQDGNVYKLVLMDCKIEDMGTIKFETEDRKSSATLVVKELPVEITRQLEDVEVYERDSATFEVELNKKDLQVQWFKKGSEPCEENGKYRFEVDGTAYSLIIRDIKLTDAGKYTCASKDSETTANLIVDPLPLKIEKDLEDVEVWEKETAVFQTELNHPDRPIVWFKKGQQLADSDTVAITSEGMRYFLTIRDAQLSDMGTIKFQVEGLKSAATLLVKELPYTFTAELEDQRAMERDPLSTFTCEMSKPDIEATWYRGEEKLKAGEKYEMERDGCVHRLLIRNVRLDDDSSYTCANKDNKTTAKLTVDPLPLEIVTDLEDVEVWEKETATFVIEMNHEGREVEWQKKGVKCEKSETVDMKSEGYKYFLVIKDCQLSDMGTVKFQSDRQKSSATLLVKELPAVFTKQLQSCQRLEFQQAVFECETSRGTAQCKWFRKGVAIEPSDKYEIRASDRDHMLIVHDVRFEDDSAYECRIVVGGEDTTSAELTVEEAPAEIMTPLKDQTVMEEETATFTCDVSKENAKVKWLKGELEVKPTERIVMEAVGKTHKLTIQKAELTDQSPFSLVATGGQTTANLTVIKIPPEFSLGVKDVKVRETETATFKCELTRDADFVRWRRNGDWIDTKDSEKYETIGKGRKHALLINNCVPEDAISYTAVVGEKESTAKLEVEELVRIVIPPEPTSVITNEVTKFECELNTEKADVTWWKEGAEIRPGEKYRMEKDKKKHTLFIADTTEADAGMYSVTAGEDQANAPLTVGEPPLKMIEGPKDQLVIEKETATFSCVTNKDGEVKWQRAGQDLEPSDKYKYEKDGTRHSLLIQDCKLDDKDTYTAVAGDHKLSAKLTVKLPAVKFGLPLDDQEIMETETATFETTVSRPCKVTWRKGGVNIEPSERVRALEDGLKHTLIIDDSVVEGLLVRALEDGLKHTLIIDDSVVEDEDTYTILADESEASAKLTVEALPLKFIRKMTLATVPLKGTAVFENELNKSVKGKWLLKGDQVIKESDKYKMTHVGKVHTLTVHDCTFDDEVEYVFVIPKKDLKAAATLEIGEPPKFVNYSPDILKTQANSGQKRSYNIDWVGIPKPHLSWEAFGPIEKPMGRSTVERQDDPQVVKFEVRDLIRKDAGTYKLKIKNKHGEDTLDLDISIIDVPGPVQNLGFTDVTRDKMSFSWEAPEDDGGSPVTGYVVEVLGPKEETWTVLTENWPDFEFIAKDLIENNEYTFRVTAQNVVGRGPPTETPKRKAKLPFDPPGPPENPQLPEVKRTQVKFTWEVPKEDGGSPITGYFVEKKLDGKEWVRVNDLKTPDLKMTIKDLPQGAEAEFRCLAVNLAGEGPPSKPMAPVKLFERPGPPQNLSLSNPSRYGVTFSYAAPADDGGTPITGYHAYRTEEGLEDWQPCADPTMDTSLKVCT
ncbi:PREDICTED: titin-like [Branchiostoma belcheri]|uniref:Titin-like n=1 Tax=Branchiostoma belcheri TaxID=7741 RepID=A0A6P4YC59_BRABE|nr:PREDICTED: titin-like [Branchiostoma belcheri]